MELTRHEAKTSKIYGTLFSNYNAERFDNSVNLFYARHKRWGIDTDWFKDKVCLDAGCGGGRFVVAIAKLGAKKVYGIDISEGAVLRAKERVRERGLDSVTDIRVASVLALPFPNHTFDYVLSSGVIHHTPNPRHGFEEVARVVKPGGTLFLSVYGKGGFGWLLNDLFRYTVCKIVPFSVMNKIWALAGIPANKRYVVLDNLYVPHCFRFTEAEVRAWLQSAGFDKIRRVKFERYDFEKIWSRIRHGEGWLQFYAEKSGKKI